MCVMCVCVCVYVCVVCVCVGCVCGVCVCEGEICMLYFMYHFGMNQRYHTTTRSSELTPTHSSTYRDVVLVIVFEVVNEVQVSEESLRGSPVVQDLLPRPGWVVDLVWLDVPHDTHGRHHQLHTSRRALHGLYDCDVCRLCVCVGV